MSDLTQYTQGYNPATDPEFNNGGAFKPLPPGWYSVYVDGSPELKETKKKREGQAQRGLFMSLAFKVIAPQQFDGRLIFGNINLDNDNQMCVDIGKRELAKLGMAIGLPAAPDSTEQLVNARLIVKVKVDGDRNAITDYKPAGQQQAPATAPVQQAAPQVQQQQAPQQPQQPPANSGPMPWQQQTATDDDDNLPF